MALIDESVWERFALEALAEREWPIVHGPDVAPGKPGGRKTWDDLILHDRAKEQLRKINPLIPHQYVDHGASSDAENQQTN